MVLEDFGQEIRITIESERISDVLEKIVKLLKDEERQENLIVQAEEGKVILPIHEILYCESVEGKTMIFCKEKVYTSKLKLYEVEEQLVAKGFMRVSKQALININEVRVISANKKAQLIASLTNGEKVLISRQFALELRERIGV